MGVCCRVKAFFLSILSFGGSYCLSGVGCRVLSVNCWESQMVGVFDYSLSGVGCRLLVVGRWLSAVGCWVLVDGS
jgi:hypothetical protein